MPEEEFFARLEPEFAARVGQARANAGRQADVERLLGKAEYECHLMRRELAAVMAGIAAPAPAAGAVAVAPAAADDVPTQSDAARAA